MRTESVVAETGGNDVWTGFLLSSFTAGLLSESLLGFLAALLLLDSFSLPEGVARIQFILAMHIQVELY
jgi:hypothetical protein